MLRNSHLDSKLDYILDIHVNNYCYNENVLTQLVRKRVWALPVEDLRNYTDFTPNLVI